MVSKGTEDMLETSLTAAYENAMERIQQQPSGRRQLAMKALAWTAFAIRPLTIRELEHAVGAQILLEENTVVTNIEVDDVPLGEDIANTCAGLLVVNEESHTVELMHYTTQEFLENTQDRWFPNVKLQILRTCLSYLSYDAFQIETGDDPYSHRAHEVYNCNNSLYNYASTNWGYHAREIPTACEEVITFLQDTRKVAAACHGALGRYDMLRYPFSGIHLAAYFGLDMTVERLLTDAISADVRDLLGRTPLMYAMEAENIAVIKTLLDRGQADANVADFWGGTALTYARSKSAIVLLMSSSNHCIDAKDMYGRTQLSYAAAQGDLECVTYMIDQLGADPDTRDLMGRTPLSYAAEKGELEILRLLINSCETNLDDPNNDGKTPLSYAAENGQSAVVDVLLRSGLAEPDRPDARGRPPLSYAVEEGHPEVVRLLLSLTPGSVNPNLTDVRSRSSLLYGLASRSDRGDEVVRLLLAQPGIDVNQPDMTGSTPLSVAARLGKAGTVRLLLDHGECNLGVTDKFGRTALSWALLQEELEVARLLVHEYVGVGAQPREFQFSPPIRRRTGFRCFVCLLDVDAGKDEVCWCKNCGDRQDSPICGMCFSDGVGCQTETHERYN